MKKNIFIFALMLFMGMTVFAGVPLQRGTFMQIRIVDAINSKQVSTPVAIVENDVMSEGKVLIKAGTPVALQVDRRKAKGCGRPGELTVTFLNTQAVDGQLVPLMGGTMNVEGRPKKGLAIGLGVGIGWFVWPGLACLAIKGEQAEIPSGTIVTNVMVGNNLVIE